MSGQPSRTENNQILIQLVNKTKSVKTPVMNQLFYRMNSFVYHSYQSDKLQSKVSNNSNSVRDYQCENSKSNCNTVEGTPQGQPIRRCKTKMTLPMCLGNLPLIELPSSNMQKNQ